MFHSTLNGSHRRCSFQLMSWLAPRNMPPKLPRGYFSHVVLTSHYLVRCDVISSHRKWTELIWTGSTVQSSWDEIRSDEMHNLRASLNLQQAFISKRKKTMTERVRVESTIQRNNHLASSNIAEPISTLIMKLPVKEELGSNRQIVSQSGTTYKY